MTAYNELVRKLNDDMLPLIHDVEAVISDQQREIARLKEVYRREHEAHVGNLTEWKKCEAERDRLRKSLLSALNELHYHFGCDAECEKRHLREEQ